MLNLAVQFKYVHNYFWRQGNISQNWKYFNRCTQQSQWMLTHRKNSCASSWLPSPIWELRLRIYIRIFPGDSGYPLSRSIITCRSSSHVRHQALSQPNSIKYAYEIPAAKECWPATSQRGIIEVITCSRMWLTKKINDQGLSGC